VQVQFEPSPASIVIREPLSASRRPVLYADPSMRPSSDAIRRGGGGPAALWTQGFPATSRSILVRIDTSKTSPSSASCCAPMNTGDEASRRRSRDPERTGISYIQDLQIALETLVRTSQSDRSSERTSRRGSVFVLRADLISVETRALLLSMARAVLVGRHGTLSEQLNHLQEADTIAAPRRARAARGRVAGPSGTTEP